MAEDLILPVPEFLSAVYLIPVALSAEGAKDRAAAATVAAVDADLDKSYISPSIFFVISGKTAVTVS